MRNTANQDIRREVAELEETLRELGRKRPLRDPMTQAVEELGFTPAQVHTLFWLGAEGAMTMGELAGRVCITEKTITGVVDRLEREEYLQRTRSDEDRRVVHVQLTRKGQATYRRFDTELKERLTRILSLLDPEDRRSLIRILQTICERLPKRSDTSTRETRKE
jgi:DNA-binding MarR family transcriptional regulator